MNVYVIYKFNDYDEVKKQLDIIKNEVSGISFFFFLQQIKRNFGII